MPSPGGLQKLAQLALVFGCLGVCLVSFLEYKDYLFRPSPTIGHLLVRARNIFLQNNAHTPPNLGEEEEEEEKTVVR